MAEGRATLRLTSDGLRAANPLSPAEAIAAKSALADSVPLLTQLAARLGEMPVGRDRIALVLQEFTGASAADVRRQLPLIQRLLRDAAPYLRPVSAASDDTVPEQIEQLPADAAMQPPTPEPLEISFSGGRISLPETAENLDAVISVLQARRGRLNEAESAG